MFMDDEKKLVEQFGLSYWDGHDMEDLLLAIMQKLLDIESRLDKRDIQQTPSYTNVALANLRDPRGSVIG